MRLGGLLFLAAALLAAAALGFNWRYAPAGLRTPWVELTLLAAGIIALFLALLVLVLEPLPGPWGRPPTMPRTDRSGPSLMALPAIVTSAAPETEPSAPPLPTVSPASIAPHPVGAPLGVSAEGSSGSTLLIPFATAPGAVSTTVAVDSAPQTVSGLVERMGAVQRAAPPRPTAYSTHASESGPVTLLQRLSQIPTPRNATSPTSPGRRCADCGEPLGSPPRFEPCGDCGRALCARCYWKTSSGPQAHLCATCVQSRSIPRPVSPAVTFGRPTAGVGPVPAPRTVQPRRPVS